MSDTHIVGGNRRELQVARVKPGGWTRARRKRFLEALAETCNVRMATEIAGMRGKSAYDLRKRDPGFGTAWQEALEVGYERLEAALLEHALERVAGNGRFAPEQAAAASRTGDAQADDGKDGHLVPGSGIATRQLATSDVQLALALLNRHRATVDGTRGATRGRRKATAAETDAALRKKLDMLARKLGSKA